MTEEHLRAVADSLDVDDIGARPDEGKLAELLLVVAEELADDRFGGATKVNKVLFFAEFAHVRMTGRPITGAVFQKLRHGPAPRRLVPARERLLAQGDAVLEREVVLGREQHRLRPLRPAQRDLFSTSELQAVTDAVAWLSGRSGSEVSALSHEEPGWQLVGEGENIPFATAYLMTDQLSGSPRVKARAEQIAAAYARRIADER